jgi:hypothetical protein
MQNILEWQNYNYTCLVAELAKLHQTIICYTEQGDSYKPVSENTPQNRSGNSLDLLTYHFQLSNFERQLLLLCVGMELDPGFAELCAKAQGNSNKCYPNLHLALSLFSGNWSALAPDASLIYWHLLKVEEGFCLADSPMRLTQWTLFFLTGQPSLDYRLLHILNPIKQKGLLPSSYQATMQQIISYCQQTQRPGCVQLVGADYKESLAIAKGIADKQQHRLYSVDILYLTQLASYELVHYSRLLLRELLFGNILYFIDCDLPLDTEQVFKLAKLLQLLQENMPSKLFLHAKKPITWLFYPPCSFALKQPSMAERVQLWQETLELDPTDTQLNPDLIQLVQEFKYYPQDIQRIGHNLLATHSKPLLVPQIWQACRSYTLTNLEGLITIVEPKADWDKLIVAEPTLASLQWLIKCYRQRDKLYIESGKSQEVGMAACFIGQAGTGKTLAVEVIGHALLLNIWQVNLNKLSMSYIENHTILDDLFNLSERNGVILLFDKLDSSFDNSFTPLYTQPFMCHLAHKLKNHTGLSLCTAHTQQKIDKVFLQSFNTVAYFNPLEEIQRLKLWQQVFPHNQLTDSDFKNLSQLEFLDAGAIRNCGRAATYNSLLNNQAINLQMIKQAIHEELIKINMPTALLDNYNK